MPTWNDARVRPANSFKPRSDGDYVLYWMQAFRRLDRNHALDYAVHLANHHGKPLVIYEGLRLDYPWASARLHTFMLEGMLANFRQAANRGMNYWPFVETPDQPARGLLRTLSQRACVVVTDDYPAFIVPAQIANLAAKIEVPLIAIDGNTIVPLQLYGEQVSACAHLRHRVHRLFPEAWNHRAVHEPTVTPSGRIDAPFQILDLFSHKDTSNSRVKLAAFVASLPIDQSVKPVPQLEGGNTAGRLVLQEFVHRKLDRYCEGRNLPDDPNRTAASGLSAYLRHGHLSIQEIVEMVLNVTGEWTPARINTSAKGKREGYYHPDPNVNSFLDEAITWRDVGYHWHYCRNVQNDLWRKQPKTPKNWHHPVFQDLGSTLPAWALKTLHEHQSDPREMVYDLAEFENAATHDPLWNAAQKELVATGRMHNYLRMLWGKKVLEWSQTPEEAYCILEHLNNKYAIDGRDPNSYTGILWCFGLFDRPWPMRKIFGTIRYMSSDSTAKKFDLDGYYKYIGKVS